MLIIFVKKICNVIYFSFFPLVYYMALGWSVDHRLAGRPKNLKAELLKIKTKAEYTPR